MTGIKDSMGSCLHNLANIRISREKETFVTHILCGDCGERVCPSFRDGPMRRILGSVLEECGHPLGVSRTEGTWAFCRKCSDEEVIDKLVADVRRLARAVAGVR